MSAVGYGINTSAAVAISTTAKSVLGIRAGAAFGLQLKHLEVGFNGTTASDGPVYVELCTCTFATNSTPGTANTNENSNIRQQYGRLLTNGMTAMSAWTSEPTVLSVLDDFWLDPNKGLLIYDYLLGQEPDTALNEGFVLRCTSATGTPSVRSSLKVERI